MAHTKSQGAAKRIVNVAGKRRGVKRYAGQTVNQGEILIRQLGTKFHPGINTGLGKDYTIFATANGVVQFRRMTGHHRTQKYIDVIVSSNNPKESKLTKIETVKKDLPEEKIAKKESEEVKPEVKIEKKEVKKDSTAKKK